MAVMNLVNLPCKSRQPRVRKIIFMRHPRRSRASRAQCKRGQSKGCLYFPCLIRNVRMVGKPDECANLLRVRRVRRADARGADARMKVYHGSEHRTREEIAPKVSWRLGAYCASTNGMANSASSRRALIGRIEKLKGQGLNFFATRTRNFFLNIEAGHNDFLTNSPLSNIF